MANDHQFEVRYTGPGPEALDEGGQTVRIGETVHVDEARAATLVASEAWEVVGRRKPTPAEPGEVAEFAIPPGDVHEEATPAGGSPDSEEG